MEFFVDRSLGAHKFPGALRAAGIPTHVHADHFRHDEADEVWIADVCGRGWVILTTDTAILALPHERDAVMMHGGTLIGLTGNAATAEAKADNFIRSLDSIERFLATEQPPLLAKLNRPSVKGRAGRVRCYMTHAQWLAARPVA